MASIIEPAASRVKSLAPDTLERVLAVAALLLLGAVIAALARGYPEWSRVPWQIWPHLTPLSWRWR